MRTRKPTAAARDRAAESSRALAIRGHCRNYAVGLTKSELETEIKMSEADSLRKRFLQEYYDEEWAEVLKTIAIITRDPDAVGQYFGFGCREVERGHSKFGDHVVIAECPEQHANWNAARLGSGLHGATVVDDLSAWVAEWGYEPHNYHPVV